MKAIYENSLISTKEKLNQKDSKCTDLRTKILKDNHDIFKDELGPEDRVNIPPVHLEVDPARNINPVKAMKPYDIPWHLRQPATIGFNKMLKSGVLTEKKRPQNGAPTVSLCKNQILTPSAVDG